MSKSKSKKKPAKSVAKKVKPNNEAKVVKALNDLRVVLSDPALAKILTDVLANIGKPVNAKKEDLPIGTLGKMIPMEPPVAPALEPVDAAPEVIETAPVIVEPVAPVVEPPKFPAIVVEDRTADNATAAQAAAPGYRGQLLEIEKLVGINEPIACEVINPDIEERKIGWGKIAKGKMPNLIILTGVNPSALGGDAKNISYAMYLKNFQGNARDVLNTFVVKRLTGQQGTKMLAAYNEFRMKNFEGNLAHGGAQVGCDPEVFVENKNGEVIPAFTFLGSKEDTKVRSGGAMGGKKVYWDGFQAEFETMQNTCLAYHVDSIQGGLAAVINAARVVDKGAKLSPKNVMETPFAMLQKTEDKFKAFGCMPSLNAYGLTAKAADPNELTFRPSGGHLHFGIGEKPDNKLVEGVKALDAVLGVACVSLFRNFDNPIRRQFYGLPGEFRKPKHGLEYRTLSSAWLMHPITAHMVFELGRKALMFGLNGYRQHWNATEKETIECIQNCDVKKAVEILERNETIFKRILSASALIDPMGGKAGRTAEYAFGAFIKGAESIIDKPEDIEGNWHLTDGKWVGHSGAANCAWNSAIKKISKGEKV